MGLYKLPLIALLLVMLSVTVSAAPEKTMLHRLGWVTPEQDLGQLLQYPQLVQNIYNQQNHKLIWLQLEDQLLITGTIEILSLAQISPIFERRFRQLNRLRQQQDYFKFDLVATDTLLIILSYRSRLLENKDTWLFGQGIPQYWPQPTLDDQARLISAMRNNKLTPFLGALGLDNEPYQAYSLAIKHLQMAQQDGSDYSANSLVRVGDVLHDRALLLRKLALAGLVVSKVDTSKDWYSRDLELIVKQFQKQHGLSSDGVIGPNTIAWLNYPIEERIRRLALNAERTMLWPTQRDSVVLVNLPSFELDYFFRGNKAFSSRVIIGKQSRKTPMLSIKMDSVVLNPTWNIPPKIMREDIIPSLRYNPKYLSSRGIQVIKGWSNPKVIDHNVIDWRRVNPKTFPYRMRQQSGSKNALGVYKFNTPNRRAIYLHDTPSKHLFDKPSRAFSSGCIRVQHAAKFASTLSKTQGFRQSNITPSKRSSNSRVPLKRRIPVHLIYQTSWVDDGKIHFRDDVYGYDKNPNSKQLVKQ